MAIALASLSLFIMWTAGEVPAWKGERFSNIGFDESGVPDSGFWPFWLCVIMFICSIWVLINAIRGKTGPSQKNEPFLDSHGVGVVLKVGGGVLAMVALTDVISMYAAMALFLFYYIFILGRHSLALSLAMALVLPFWMYLFFDITMTTTLPKGILAVEDNVYAPLDSYFRATGQIEFVLYFLAGGAVLVAGSMLERRSTATD
ncbi:tripartite tricarboxylate transporter TctB family protein [Rhodobacteraceae bacterium NNCM2]|nr:tripartite tricarboxylate transporter TctB family protein [Coraliihabitans acroporae]